MKPTIKELEDEIEVMNKGGKPIEVRDLGKLYALKDILVLIKNAVETLKNNYWALGKKENKEKTKEFAIGIYNRFDECGLIYSDIKGISFNEAIVELGLQELMEELKIKMEIKS